MEIYCISAWHIIRIVCILFFELNAFWYLWHRALFCTEIWKYAEGKTFLLLAPYAGADHVRQDPSSSFSSQHTKRAGGHYYCSCRPWLRQVAKVDTHFWNEVHLRAYSPLIPAYKTYDRRPQKAKHPVS